jgi:hypothetical protein
MIDNMTQDLGHTISLPDAKDLAGNYLKIHGEKALQSVRFGRDIFDKLLANPKAAGLRVVMGADGAGDTCLMFIATDQAGNDIYPNAGASAAKGTESEDPGIETGGWICPINCVPQTIIKKP